MYPRLDYCILYKELCVLERFKRRLCVRMASKIKKLTKGNILDILTDLDNCLTKYISENDIKILFKIL